MILAHPHWRILKPFSVHGTIGTIAKKCAIGRIMGIDSILITSEDATAKAAILLQLHLHNA